MIEFAGPATPLTPGDIEAEAAEIGCEPAIIYAVCDVEAGKSGFLPSGKPKILFEAHVFGRLTDHQGDRDHPNISAPRWDRSLYGAGGEHQYDRLAEAMELDREAALKSASWGMFQIMGMNAGLCGYNAANGAPDVEAFVKAMVTGERAHLDAFTKFCVANYIDDDLRARRFDTFTRVYNGPGQVEHYSTLLAAAYRKARANPAARPTASPRVAQAAYQSVLRLNSRGPAVVALQKQLAGLGYDVETDGDFGPVTMAAVVAFQRYRGLVPDGVAGPRWRGWAADPAKWHRAELARS